jgi:hypothetical protein
MSETVIVLIILMSYYYYLRHSVLGDILPEHRNIETYAYILTNEIGFFVHSLCCLVFYFWKQEGWQALVFLLLGWLFKKINQSVKDL